MKPKSALMIAVIKEKKAARCIQQKKSPHCPALGQRYQRYFNQELPKKNAAY